MGEPIGSLTQLGTIRLGTRTENRVPLIRDFVSLAQLDDLVFGAWDVFPDDAPSATSVATRRNAACSSASRVSSSRSSGCG
jgi:myo-inositol-1-phosphate synthase